MTSAPARPTLLLCATTTGYQTRAFDAAAERHGADLVLATDRCDHLDDPWRDRAIAVRFHDEAESVAAIGQALHGRRLDGVLAVGERPAVLAAQVAAAHRLPWHSVRGARTASDKRQLRACQRAAGVLTPHGIVLDIDAAATLPVDVRFPCVVKPLVLSGSRGVIRVDDAAALAGAVARVARILDAPDVRSRRDAATRCLLIEDFVAGHEFAVEGLMVAGEFHTLAVFDKPVPLDGPFFEETLYVTPTDRTLADGARAASAVAEVAGAMGLWHGPVHAECRMTPAGVVVLEVAARPIGGLCARALTFIGDTERSLEDVLVGHALGETTVPVRASEASGVLMMPTPRLGVLRAVTGVEAARLVAGVTEVTVTAKAGQVLVPLPEGASYLGFIFSTGASDRVVLEALERAHALLRLDLATHVPVQTVGA